MYWLCGETTHRVDLFSKKELRNCLVSISRIKYWVVASAEHVGRWGKLTIKAFQAPNAQEWIKCPHSMPSGSFQRERHQEMQSLTTTVPVWASRISFYRSPVPNPKRRPKGHPLYGGSTTPLFSSHFLQSSRMQRANLIQQKIE